MLSQLFFLLSFAIAQSDSSTISMPLPENAIEKTWTIELSSEMRSTVPNQTKRAESSVEEIALSGTYQLLPNVKFEVGFAALTPDRNSRFVLKQNFIALTKESWATTIEIGHLHSPLGFFRQIDGELSTLPLPYETATELNQGYDLGAFVQIHPFQSDLFAFEAAQGTGINQTNPDEPYHRVKTPLYILGVRSRSRLHEGFIHWSQQNYVGKSEQSFLGSGLNLTSSDLLHNWILCLNQEFWLTHLHGTEPSHITTYLLHPNVSWRMFSSGWRMTHSIPSGSQGLIRENIFYAKWQTFEALALTAERVLKTDGPEKTDDWVGRALLTLNM